MRIETGAIAVQDIGILPPRRLARRHEDHRLSWLWLFVAIMVLALGGLIGSRKW